MIPQATEAAAGWVETSPIFPWGNGSPRNQRPLEGLDLELLDEPCDRKSFLCLAIRPGLASSASVRMMATRFLRASGDGRHRSGKHSIACPGFAVARQRTAPKRHTSAEAWLVGVFRALATGQLQLPATFLLVEPPTPGAPCRRGRPPRRLLVERVLDELAQALARGRSIA